MHQLKVNQQQTIVALHQQGWSKRKIARELGVDRSAVRRYLDVAEAKLPANPQTGTTHQGGRGPESLCEPWKEHIEAALAAGLSIERIHRDLVAEHPFSGSYDSVWRFVRKLELVLELPFRRMEVEQGAELQVDFGQGAWVIENGKRRRLHLFRAVLSHSRKSYSEAVWRQTTGSFIGCLENTFRHLGGVSRTVVIDNLRAAVSRADWFDPDLKSEAGGVLPTLRHGGFANAPGDAAARPSSRLQKSSTK